MTETVEKGLKKIGVTVSKPVLALIAFIFGLLVIILPELLPGDCGIILHNTGSAAFHRLHGSKTKELTSK